MHMHMSFWWGPDLGEFLIPGLNIKGTGSLIGLCIVLTILAIVFESMKIHGARARARAAREKQTLIASQPNESANLLAVDFAPKPPMLTRSLKLIGELCLFLSHNILSYALMLSVMVYNGYVFIAVIVGLGIGYFIFGHISMKINMENVQARTTNAICTSRNMTDAERDAMVGNSPSTSYNTLAPSASETTVGSTSRILGNEKL